MTPRPDTSYHILIVEDNRTQAEYLRHILEKKGHQVMVSTNGIEALEMIEAEKPDLILTDVMMPDMDGYKLCETIKNHKRYHDIPVILVTHLYSPVDVIRGLEAGADNFIIKPYDPESIFSRIAGIMQAAACPSEEQNQPLDVVFSSEVHTISSSRIQILNILLSTYETAVKNNSELQVAHERLHYTNAQLQKLVDDLEKTNESLQLKNLERTRLEAALTAAQKKNEIIAHLVAIVHEWLQPAYDQLMRETLISDANEMVTHASSHLHAGIVALENCRQYLKMATMPRTWQGIRNSINHAIEQVRRPSVRYENHIPEDIEIFADPWFAHVLSYIIMALQKDDEIATQIRFTFHVRENGYVIICESNASGIADLDNEVIFSIHEKLVSFPSLCLVREMLALSDMDIIGTGSAGQGIRFEIGCLESSVRFGSDVSIL